MPANIETYCKVISINQNPRLEILSSYSRSILSIIEVLSEKFERALLTQLYYIEVKAIQELWKKTEVTDHKHSYDKRKKHNSVILSARLENKKKEVNLNSADMMSMHPMVSGNLADEEIKFSVLNEKTLTYDLGDVWIGYGRSNSNLVYLQYRIIEREFDSAQLNKTMKFSKSNLIGEAIHFSGGNNIYDEACRNNKRKDERYLFDPLDFLGLYDDEKKDDDDCTSSSSENGSSDSNKNLEKKELIEVGRKVREEEVSLSNYSEAFRMGKLNSNTNFCQTRNSLGLGRPADYSNRVFIKGFSPNLCQVINQIQFTLYGANSSNCIDFSVNNNSNNKAPKRLPFTKLDTPKKTEFKKDNIGYGSMPHHLNVAQIAIAPTTICQNFYPYQSMYNSISYLNPYQHNNFANNSHLTNAESCNSSNYQFQNLKMEREGYGKEQKKQPAHDKSQRSSQRLKRNEQANNTSSKNEQRKPINKSSIQQYQKEVSPLSKLDIMKDDTPNRPGYSIPFVNLFENDGSLLFNHHVGIYDENSLKMNPFSSNYSQPYHDVFRKQDYGAESINFHSINHFSVCNSNRPDDKSILGSRVPKKHGDVKKFKYS